MLLSTKSRDLHEILLQLPLHDLGKIQPKGLQTNIKHLFLCSRFFTGQSFTHFLVSQLPNPQPSKPRANKEQPQAETSATLTQHPQDIRTRQLPYWSKAAGENAIECLDSVACNPFILVGWYGGRLMRSLCPGRTAPSRSGNQPFPSGCGSECPVRGKLGARGCFANL